MATDAYKEGQALGRRTKNNHDAGGDFDPRFDMADAAKRGRDYFDQFKAGMNSAWEEDDDD